MASRPDEEVGVKGASPLVQRETRGEYTPFSVGTTLIPSSIDDESGGRSDLNSRNIKWPVIDEDVVMGLSPGPSSAPVAAVPDRVVESAPAAPSVARMRVPPFRVPLPGAPVVSVRPADKIEPRIEPRIETRGHVSVTMRSDRFGTFRSRPADVFDCEHHVALLYNGTDGGDAEMVYEPPLFNAFDLVIPLTNGRSHTHKVVHMGLTTRLSDGSVLVVLIKDNEVPGDVV